MKQEIRTMKTWLIVGALCGSLLAISEPVGADCTTRFGCLTCTLTASCVRVAQDRHCTCIATTEPFVSCFAAEECDYTGSPSCENPTPAGECPSFMPVTPKDDATSLSAAAAFRTGFTGVEVRADEVFDVRSTTLPKDDDATSSDAKDSGSTEE